MYVQYYVVQNCAEKLPLLYWNQSMTMQKHIILKMLDFDMYILSVAKGQNQSNKAK